MSLSSPAETIRELERIQLEPALGLRRFSIATPSGQLAFVDEGKGRPVVLLHGAPMTSLAFVRVIRALSTSCRVLAPDLPGFGGSEPSTTFDGTLSAYARSIEEFCTALDLLDAVLFVTDSSGAMGLVAASNMPHRVAGLVIADTVPLPMTGAAALVRLALRHVITAPPVRVANRRWNLLPWMVATVAPWRRPLPVAERRILTAQFATASQRDRVFEVFAHMGRDDAFMSLAADRARMLSAKPALILYGQFDPMRLVGGVRRFAAVFPRHHLVIVPWEEHFPILGAGTEVADAIRSWLRTID